MGGTFAQDSDPMVWKSIWIIKLGFYKSGFSFTKAAQRAQTEARASSHRVSLMILCVWLLLWIFNFSMKNFVMAVMHHMQTINSSHHSCTFSNTMELFIKGLKNSILVPKVIQFSAAKHVSNSSTVCRTWQRFICGIPREQGQAV